MTFVVNSQIVLRQADVIILVLKKCLLGAGYMLTLCFVLHSEEPHLNISESFTGKSYEAYLLYNI
jgi:hypothetical protein